ncbi:Serine carboxypeptidase-like 18-like protein [Drosera capensis]
MELRVMKMMPLAVMVMSFLLVTNRVMAGNRVRFLPGYDGELPFKLETGYTSVKGSEMFYYFLESEGNPKEDPFMLWFSGGPGCSAFNGLIYQIGPIAFNITPYEGGLPTLQRVEATWTKSASILFVDSPVGSGFSYATDLAEYYTSDSKWAEQTYLFLKNWMVEHPQYLKLQLFIGADSYAGVPGPIIVQKVLDGNAAGDYPHLNLKGYILGCPRTDMFINDNAKIKFCHRMGAIPDDLYEAALENCDGNYFHQENTSNIECMESVHLIKPLMDDLNTYSYLEPACIWSSPDHQTEEGTQRRSLGEEPEKSLISPFKIPDLWCRNFNYSLSYIWANDIRVQKALHVREGTIQEWVRCNNTLNYDYDVTSVLGIHQNLKNTNLYALVYSGDHDLTVPHVGTQDWINLLNMSIDKIWSPWFVNGEVAGYTIKYSNNWFTMNFATIKGAGHSPQEYKRSESYEMFRRWIHWYPI